MGDDEPIEFLLESRSALRRRILRMMKNAKMQDEAMAAKPRTTMTAIAQCGKPESSSPDCTFPLPSPLPLGPEPDSVDVGKGDPVVDAAAIDDDDSIEE